jgi:hypothetical protein
MIRSDRRGGRGLRTERELQSRSPHDDLRSRFTRFTADRSKLRSLVAKAAAYRVVQDRYARSIGLAPATRTRTAIDRAARSLPQVRRCLGQRDRSDPRRQVVSNASERLPRVDHRKNQCHQRESSPPPNNSSARAALQRHRAIRCRLRTPASRHTACARCSNRGCSRPV